MIRRTLKYEMLLYFSFLVILPVTVVTVLIYAEVRQSTSKMLEDGLSKLVFELGLEVESAVYESYKDIVSLAQNSVLKSVKSTASEKLAELEGARQLYKTYESITLIDSGGSVITSTNANYRDRSRMQKVKTGLPAVSSPYEKNNPKRFVMDISFPVTGEDGGPQSVLIGQINLQSIWEIVDRITIGRSGYVFLVDKSGRLIACPDKRRLLTEIEPLSLRNAVLSDHSGVYRYKDDDNVDRIAVFQLMRGFNDYEGLGWHIGIIQDLSEVFALVFSIQRKIAIIAVCGILFIILCANMLIRNVVKPVKELTETTKKIAGGNLNARV